MPESNLGGHTSELLLLMRDFDFEQSGIKTVHAVIGSDGDILSEKKLLEQKWIRSVNLKVRLLFSIAIRSIKLPGDVLSVVRCSAASHICYSSSCNQYGLQEKSFAQKQ